MKTEILILSGKKQSGKSSAARFIAGDILKRHGIITHRDMDDEGNLLVNSWVDGESGKEEQMAIFPIDMNIFDLMKNERLYDFMTEVVYPKVKIYSIADPLKEIAVQIFGVKPEQVYGTDAQKNSVTSLTWDDFKHLLPVSERKKLAKSGHFVDKEKGFTGKKISARNILEILGTRVFRQVKPDCWIEALFRRIEIEQPEIAIISDGRFPNEIDKVHERGGKSIRFTKNPFDSKTEPETALDNYKRFRATVHNEHMHMREKNIKLMETLHELGFLNIEVGG